MTDLEFHAWVRRLMDGDQAAFEAVYEHTVDDVFRTVTFLMGNTHDVHDLVNEVYIEMWKSLPSYDPNRSFQQAVVQTACCDHPPLLPRLLAGGDSDLAQHSCRDGQVKTSPRTQGIAQTLYDFR